MKKTATLLILSLCIACVSSPAAALTLTLTPSSQTVVPGEDVFLNLDVAGLTAGGPDSLGAFQVDVLYDDSLFSFSDVTFGTLLGDPDLFEALVYHDDSIPGKLYLEETSFLFDWELDTIQGETFTLATLQFSSHSSGSGSFEIDDAVLSDGFGSSLPIDSIQNSTVTSTDSVPVPEPSTILVLATGLIGIAGFRRKFRGLESF